jgi:hypothetical protein
LSTIEKYADAVTCMHELGAMSTMPG